MIYQINQKFNVETEAKMIVGGLGTVIGASMVGRTVASNLLKFIPIVGSVAAVGTAAAITKAMGEAYIVTLRNLCKRYIEEDRNTNYLDMDDIIEEFKNNFKPPKK